MTRERVEKELPKKMRRAASGTIGEMFDVQTGEVGGADFWVKPRFFRGRLVTHSGTGTGGEAIALACEPSLSEAGALAHRAILESRIVGRVLQFGRQPDLFVAASELEDLPIPTIPAGVRTQLSALYRRRSSPGVDDGIERVVAELYELDLEVVVGLQSTFLRRPTPDA